MNVATGKKTLPYNINPIWKPMRAACKVDNGIVLGYSAVGVYACHNVVEESFYGGRAGWYIAAAMFKYAVGVKRVLYAQLIRHVLKDMEV